MPAVQTAVRALREDPRRFRMLTSMTLHRRAAVSRAIVRAFHRLYYYSPERTFRETYWFGHSVKKCPFDLWVYQEMLHELRPDFIVETGTRFGGSARFFASICDLLDQGRIVSVDIDPAAVRPEHPRITYLEGSSTAPEIVAQVRETVGAAQSVLVVLDSDHSCAHVLEELRAYAGLVTPGSYVVVEDTNVNGHPVRPDFGPGPMEAVDLFLRERADFSIDGAREKFFLSFNPRGYLRRAV
jgi:cephalosporin hydroxylase